MWPGGGGGGVGGSPLGDPGAPVSPPTTPKRSVSSSSTMESGAGREEAERETRARAQSGASTLSTAEATSADERSSSETEGQSERTAGSKRARRRTIIQHSQLDILEQAYARDRLPDARTRARLGKETGLSERVVRIWFQNRRAKDKRHSMAVDAAMWPLPEVRTMHCAPAYPPTCVHYVDSRTAGWQPWGASPMTTPVPVTYYSARPAMSSPVPVLHSPPTPPQQRATYVWSSGVTAPAPWGVTRYVAAPVTQPGAPVLVGQPAVYVSESMYAAYSSSSQHATRMPAESASPPARTSAERMEWPRE